MIWSLWATYILISAIIDSDRYKAHKKILHWYNTVERTVVAVLLYFLLGQGENWTIITFYFLGCFFSYWLAFNILFNLMIGKEWTYVGSTSKLDILESKVPIIFMLWMKALCAFAAIYTYYHTDLL